MVSLRPLKLVKIEIRTCSGGDGFTVLNPLHVLSGSVEAPESYQYSGDAQDWCRADSVVCRREISLFALEVRWTPAAVPPRGNSSVGNNFMTPGFQVAYAALHGMRLDIFHVVTADNWRLQIHRVQSPDIFNRSMSTPVLVAHGSKASSGDFMMNPRRESLAFILADNGYDVFLVNFRSYQFSNEKVTSSGEIVPPIGEDMYETS